MKTQYYTASSLDGFIAAPGNSLDWLMQFGEMEDSTYPAFIQEVGALAMGSQTYEWVRRHLTADGKSEPWPYDQPTWVFTSRTLPAISGADLRFVRGDVRPVHEVMAKVAGGKNVWVVGGGELAGQFHDQGLLDELIVQVAPVTLGKGAPLLPRAIWNPPLKRLSVTPLGNAFVEIRYALPPPHPESGTSPTKSTNASPKPLG
jgi:dihydrofolate reductase